MPSMASPTLCWAMASPLPTISWLILEALKRVPHQSIYSWVPTYQPCFHFMCLRKCPGPTSPSSVCIPASSSAATTKKKSRALPSPKHWHRELRFCIYSDLSKRLGSFPKSEYTFHINFIHKFSTGLLHPLELGCTASDAYFVFPFSRLQIPQGRDPFDICNTYGVVRITNT